MSDRTKKKKIQIYVKRNREIDKDMYVDEIERLVN